MSRMVYRKSWLGYIKAASQLTSIRIFRCTSLYSSDWLLHHMSQLWVTTEPINYHGESLLLPGGASTPDSWITNLVLYKLCWIYVITEHSRPHLPTWYPGRPEPGPCEASRTSSRPRPACGHLRVHGRAASPPCGRSIGCTWALTAPSPDWCPPSGCSVGPPPGRG